MKGSDLQAGRLDNEEKVMVLGAVVCATVRLICT